MSVKTVSLSDRDKVWFETHVSLKEAIECGTFGGPSKSIHYQDKKARAEKHKQALEHCAEKWDKSVVRDFIVG